MAGTYQDFLSALGQSESSNRYDYVNPMGYAGRYQAGESALRMTGYYQWDGTSAVDWNGGWTDKARVEGVNSLEDFLANHAFQDKVVTDYYKYLWNTNFEGSNLKEFIGQTIAGIKITESGLLAGSHLVGANNVELFLRSSGTQVPTDPWATPVAEYITKFGGYDVNPVTGTTTTPSVQTPTVAPAQETTVAPAQEPTSDVVDQTVAPAQEPTPVQADQTLVGTNRADNLVGGSGNDTISGKNGNDQITGAGGSDLLWGDRGSDSFVFEAGFGHDTIKDFETGRKSDFIQFDADLFPTFGDVMARTTDTSDGALISYDANNSVLIEGMSKASLAAAESSFLFI